MIIKYELHFKTEHSLKHISKMLTDKGIEHDIELCYDKVKVYLKQHDIYMDMKLYGVEDDYYIYELGTTNFESFIKIKEMLK